MTDLLNLAGDLLSLVRYALGSWQRTLRLLAIIAPLALLHLVEVVLR